MTVVFLYTYRGVVRLDRMSILSHRGEISIAVVDDDDGNLATVERNLKGLIMHIPNTRMRETPYRLQSHTVGVPDSVNALLRQVAREIVCYHEHNTPVDE